MNELDLQTKIEGLKKAIAEHEDFTGTYKSQLEQAKQALADINKPELTSSQMDDVYEAIERGVSEYDFSDSENFDKEFGIDYEGRVTLESFDINNSQELVEAIVKEVNKLFAEKLDTTEADHHQMETLQE